MGKIDNIKPYRFQPGHSGNPSGRPKGSISLTARLRKELEKQVQLADGTKIKAIDAIVKKMVIEAIRGNERLITLAFERIDGKELDKEAEDKANELQAERSALDQLLGRDE
jgi:hypothetical protein